MYAPHLSWIRTIRAQIPRSGMIVGLGVLTWVVLLLAGIALWRAFSL